MKQLILVVLYIFAVAHGGFADDTNAVALKDIAGDYYFGDGLGVNCMLTLSARGAFTFQWRGCLGIYDQNEGSASLKDGMLQITPQKPNVGVGFRGTPTAFYPVRWGARMYLIPTNEMVKFCSDVNQGTEPRQGDHGGYYIRRQDARKAVAGRPEVPEQWRKFFLDQPVRGTITELIGTEEAWLNKGAADGLLEGMILTAQQHGALMFAQVQVEAVEKSRCRIRREWTESGLAVGQTVSSRFFEVTRADLERQSWMNQPYSLGIFVGAIVVMAGAALFAVRLWRKRHPHHLRDETPVAR